MTTWRKNACLRFIARSFDLIMLELYIKRNTFDSLIKNRIRFYSILHSVLLWFRSDKDTSDCKVLLCDISVSPVLLLWTYNPASFKVWTETIRYETRGQYAIVKNFMDKSIHLYWIYFLCMSWYSLTFC